MAWYAPLNPTTSKVRVSLRKLSGVPKQDLQIDLPEGLDVLARRDTMEWRHAGPQLVQSDPHQL
jgi:hypothetical protein